MGEKDPTSKASGIMRSVYDKFSGKKNWEVEALNMSRAIPPATDYNAFKAQVSEQLSIAENHFKEFLPRYEVELLDDVGEPDPAIHLKVEKITTLPLNSEGEMMRYLVALDGFLAQAAQTFIRTFDNQAKNGIMIEDYKKNTRYGVTPSSPIPKMIIVNLYPVFIRADAKRFIAQTREIIGLLASARNFKRAFQQTELMLKTLNELE